VSELSKANNDMGLRGASAGFAHEPMCGHIVGVIVVERIAVVEEHWRAKRNPQTAVLLLIEVERLQQAFNSGKTFASRHTAKQTWWYIEALERVETNETNGCNGNIWWPWTMLSPEVRYKDRPLVGFVGGIALLVGRTNECNSRAQRSVEVVWLHECTMSHSRDQIIVGDYAAAQCIDTPQSFIGIRKPEKGWQLSTLDVVDGALLRQVGL
jgi:hypothetical protein